MKILLIEPDGVLSLNTSTFLKNLQHELFVVSSAESAIHALDEQAIELIILEPKMPDHNGIELIHELRSYDDLNNIPILIFTSLSPTQLNLSLQEKNQLGVRNVFYKSQTSLDTLAKNIKQKQNA